MTQPMTGTACPIEDRLALQDLITSFAHAVDSMHDVDGILACFTADCVIDLSGIGMARVEGHAGVRGFYEGAFAAHSHHAHIVSNLAVTGYTGETATVRTYVTGMARSKDGSNLVVHGRYYFGARRTPEGWRFTGYTMDFLLPPG